jgi:hypothetical protein
MSCYWWCSADKRSLQGSSCCRQTVIGKVKSYVIHKNNVEEVSFVYIFKVCVFVIPKYPWCIIISTFSQLNALWFLQQRNNMQGRIQSKIDRDSVELSTEFAGREERVWTTNTLRNDGYFLRLPLHCLLITKNIWHDSLWEDYLTEK